MAGLATKRVYLTNDGKLALEGSHDIAFLKYPVGEEIEADDVEEYEALVNPPSDEDEDEHPPKAASKPANKQAKAAANK